VAILFASTATVLAAETLDFQQLNWYGLTGPIQFSDWGQVTLSYDDPGIAQYLNLNVDGNWVVQNVCVPTGLPAGGGGGGGCAVNLKFDLGVADGTQVNSLNYGYSLTTEPATSVPEIQGSAAVTQRDYQIGGEGGYDLGGADKPTHSPQKDAAPNGPKTIAIIPGLGGFVNQPQGPNECAPGAISNSLKYLKSRGKVQGLNDDISDIKPIIGWGADGAPADWPTRKKNHFENKTGQRVNTRFIEAPLTLAKAMDLINQLKDGQDIEVDLKGHVEVLVGLALNKDGTVDLVLADDDQKDAQSDPLHISGLMTNGTVQTIDGMELERFVVECPGAYVWSFYTLFQQGDFIYGVGDGYGEGTWYFYPFSERWNQWFSVQDFSTARYMEARLQMNVTYFGPGSDPFEGAVAWSTPLWPMTEYPPLPGFFSSPEEEEMNITRETVYLNYGWDDVVEHTLVVPDYNPMWACIDLRQLEPGLGEYEVDGTLSLECKPKSYTLTVIDGEGGGVYPYGTVTMIQADVPPDSFFDVWDDPSGVVEDPTAAITVATVPWFDAEVIALYSQGYRLTVNSGSADGIEGGGVYPESAYVQVVADAPGPDSFFDVWVGDLDILDDPLAAETTAVIPARDTEITATFGQLPMVTLTVNSGTGSGMYTAGSLVQIQADTPPPDSFFDVWMGDVGFLDYPVAASTNVFLSADVQVTATYTDEPQREDAFSVILDHGMVAQGGGSGYGWGTWFQYELYEWWNQWWYDHPYDAARMKVGTLHLEVNPTNNMGHLEVAVNWATPLWQPGSPTPPLPGTYDPATEDQIIGREIVYYWDPSQPTIVDVPFEISAYNPEWISVDIRDLTGVGVFEISGIITHECAPKAPVYVLTVNSGSGGGSFAAGTQVTVVADGPPPDSFFDVWVGSTEILDDPFGSTAIATVPAYDTQITATYRGYVILTVNSGSGGGTYPPGTVVNIVADPAPPDSFFDVWAGDLGPVDYPQAASTNVTMNSDVTVTATYTDSAVRTDSFTVTLYDGQVTEGAGTGYGYGQWYYYEWEQWWNQWWYDHPFSYDRKKVVMLHLDVFPLTGSNGTIEVAVNWATPDWPIASPTPPLPGMYMLEDEPLIIGRMPIYMNPGMQESIDLWLEIPDYNPEWVSVDIRDLTMMGRFHINGTITHECAPKPPVYVLTVNSGGGGGMYGEGTIINIDADAPPPGANRFLRWTGDTACVAHTTWAHTQVTMPAADTQVTAEYTLIADLSGDRFVGQADLDIILGSWGQHVAELSAPDPSGDGFVGQADLDIILSYWGQSYVP
jgi:hypothetical protein